MNYKLHVLLFAGMLLGILFNTAGYACSGTTQDVFSVGNKVADSSCNYGAIQDAIDAATCANGTRIVINAGLAYDNQHLTITNKNISLVGRGSSPQCGTPQPVCGQFIACPVGPLETINGNSGAVVTVRGASAVTISHLTITGGHGNDGGGIDYSGTGTLNIDNSDITENNANNGAGIRFVGNGGVADLYLNANTFISYNTAVHTGGGIRTDDQAKVHIDAEPIWIEQNTAGDYGGGIAVVGGAYAHIGSPGYKVGDYLPVIYQNTAHSGGGIAVIGESTGDATVELLASNPDHPVLVEQNRAAATGGGIYAIPYNTLTSLSAAMARLGGAHIDNNVAKEGAGVYLDYMSADSDFGGDLEFVGGQCSKGVECTTISNNRALDINNSNQPTAGSTVLLQSSSFMNGSELVMRGNHGAHAIRFADSAELTMDSCLLAGNVVDAELIASGTGLTSISQCTIAGNTIGALSAISAVSSFSFTNSIVAQASKYAVLTSGSASDITLEYLMLDPAAPEMPPSGSTIFKADPAFVDAANGDYYLKINSPGIDVAPAQVGDQYDLDHNLRDVDLPNVININGSRDLGAYERQLACGASDTIFCNGFEP